VGLDELCQAVAACKLVLFDTIVFSYQLADHPRYAPLTTAILELVESGQVAGLVTTVTLAEILTVPAQAGDRQAMQDYELYLTGFPHLTMVPLDEALARETALVRGTTGLRMPDAIQVAAARLAGAGAIVTNDRRWSRTISQPALLLLDDYLAGS
jgi:predicted nucleic acid-binding protein